MKKLFSANRSGYEWSRERIKEVFFNKLRKEKALTPKDAPLHTECRYKLDQVVVLMTKEEWDQVQRVTQHFIDLKNRKYS